MNEAKFFFALTANEIAFFMIQYFRLADEASEKDYCNKRTFESF